MYKFPAKLKIGAIVLMILGLGLTVISFMSAPKTLDEAKAIIAEQASAHSDHGDAHNTHSNEHKKGDKHEVNANHSEESENHSKHKSEDTTDSHSDTKKVNDTVKISSDNAHKIVTDHPKDTTQITDAHVEDAEKSVKQHKDKISEKVEEHTDIANSDLEKEKKEVGSHDKKIKDKVENHSDTIVEVVKETENNPHAEETHHTDTLVSNETKGNHHNLQGKHKEDTHGVAHKNTHNSHVKGHNAEGHDEHHGDHHAEHVFHQLQNRPVSAFYVAMLFFLGISLLVMAFYAGQRIAQSGWSVVLFRVFEAISNNLHYVSVVMLLFIIGTAMHKFHLFPWMKEGTLTPGHENFDSIVYGKKWFLNIPGWTIRSVAYLVIWNVLRFIIRRMSIKQDNGDLKLHKRLFNMSVAFVGTFLVTESMMSWDWIMGIDPHWFSTLFGWYVLATFLVCALTLVAMITIYLRSQGFLPLVNDSHIHDLAKFMFGFSVFWTYLWFCQFMLVWYADMPEETTYFVQRFNDYKLPFLGMIAMNFLFPVLILLNSDFKSMPWFVFIAGVIILAGHYIDLYVMIMPGTVGDQYGFGIGEIGGLLFFTGLFIFATFSAFAKADPIPKGNPFLHESETFHYYIIKHRGESDHDHH